MRLSTSGNMTSDLTLASQACCRAASSSAGPLSDAQIRDRPSTASNFLSITYVIQATSQEQLDAIYRELTACEAVLMAL